MPCDNRCSPLDALSPPTFLLVSADYDTPEASLVLALPAQFKHACFELRMEVNYLLSPLVTRTVIVKTNKYAQFRIELPFVMGDAITEVHIEGSVRRCFQGASRSTFINPSTAASSTGPTGPCCDSPPGPTGQDGARGITGPRGFDGPQGALGVHGPTGPVGNPGATGPQGQSLTGPAGPPANDSMGDAGSTGMTGMPSSATNTGAAGPIGAMGPTGQTGLEGGQALTGATGPPSATGPAGATGVPGFAGMTGAAGAVGLAGPTGLQGASGNGPTGPTGTLECPPLGGIVETTTPFVACDSDAPVVRSIEYSGTAINCDADDELVLVSGTTFIRRPLLPQAVTVEANLPRLTDSILTCRDDNLLLVPNMRDLVFQQVPLATPLKTVLVENFTQVPVPWTGATTTYPRLNLQNNYDGNTGIYTVPRTGRYRFTAEIVANLTAPVSDTWSNSTFMFVRFVLNGFGTLEETRFDWTARANLNPPPFYFRSLDWCGDLTAGAQVLVEAEGSYGGPPTITGEVILDYSTLTIEELT